MESNLPTPGTIARFVADRAESRPVFGSVAERLDPATRQAVVSRYVHTGFEAGAL